jgi:nitrogen regulatory protein PII
VTIDKRPVKQIIAVVKPYLAVKIVEALRRAPLEALTVREVKGYGRQFLPKVEIEAWVDDARVGEVVDRITQLAHTGRMGDGKVFILPVKNAEQV